MKGFVADYKMKSPKSLNEVLHILQEEPLLWKVFAGGTDLMVVLEAGKLRHKNFLNIASLSELQGIQTFNDQIRIGALSTYSQIQLHADIQNEFPLMVRSGWVTGAKAIQNRGTIGGNIANASPAADTPPSLLAYGAHIELISARGSRVLPYDQFHLDYKKTQMNPDEVIAAVILKRRQNWTHHYYRKVGTRSFQSISKVAVAAAAQIENGLVQKIQVGLASVGPKPLRAEVLEKALQQQPLTKIKVDNVIEQFEKSIAPLDDIRSTARYRQVVAGRVVGQLIQCLSQKAGVYTF